MQPDNWQDNITAALNQATMPQLVESMLQCEGNDQQDF